MQGKRLFLVSFWIFLGVAALFLWTAETEQEAHYTPEYTQIDLEPLLQKTALEEEDYVILFSQTGLSKTGVDELYGEGRQEELLYLQQRFLEPIEYECSHINAICCSERLAASESDEQQISGDFLPTVHTGDILITFSSHILGWRSGHAGIVVDGEKGLSLEAITLGYNSEICNVEHWKEYPCFVLLRLKDSSEEETEKIAAYARENLADIPYDLASFTDRRQITRASWQQEEISQEEAAGISGTQCAHLVWAAFYHFGYDLDSDGGLVVTPADLCGSDLLEVVQVYGMNY